MTVAFDWDRYNGIPIVGIMRKIPVPLVLPSAEAVVAGGIRTLEITIDSPEATRLIGELHAHFGERVNIGAGTVCTFADYRKAVDAGASFIVTPIVAEEVIAAGKAENVPVFAGAFTPTEAYRAWSLGAAFVKIFPADQLGPGYIKALYGPLSQIRFVPTGGVTVETLPAFRRAGAQGYGVGSPLFDRARIAAHDTDWLHARARAFRDAYVNN